MSAADRLVIGTLNVWGRWADWPSRREQVQALLERREDPPVLGADLNDTPTWPMCDATFGRPEALATGCALAFQVGVAVLLACALLMLLVSREGFRPR